jgi:hypothetical protein
VFILLLFYYIRFIVNVNLEISVSSASRNGSVRFGSGSVFATPVSNRQESEPKPVRFGSVRFLAGSEPKELDAKRVQKALDLMRS